MSRFYFFLSLIAMPASAQSGSLRGLATDESGAIVQRARITVIF